MSVRELDDLSNRADRHRRKVFMYFFHTGALLVIIDNRLRRNSRPSHDRFAAEFVRVDFDQSAFRPLHLAPSR